MGPSDRAESRALLALTGLVRGSFRRPSAAELERGLAAFRDRIAAGNSRRRGALRGALVLSVLVACVVAAVAGTRAYRDEADVLERPVALERIEGGEILEGGYLLESGKAGVELFFDEGSRFVLTPGTRGRLRLDRQEGTRLAVEHGTASLRITQSRERRWSVEAGPFLVTVRGTDFTVVWEPANERFELVLRRGRVLLSGPIVGDGLALQPGQKLTVSLAKAEMVITEERPEPGSSRATLSAPSPSAEPSALPPPIASGASALAVPRAAPSSAPPSGAGVERRWREALAKGRWDEILADAERDGMDATLETASSDELFALSDAARYRRRTELARAALLAHRRRFPSSPRSVDAVFLLGRIEELRANGKAPALRWYEEYLARAPTGTYAAEALGRKMILAKETGGPASARPIAEEYLRRFPEGSYAGAARALQRGP